jgi:hypothetical protein
LLQVLNITTQAAFFFLLLLIHSKVSCFYAIKKNTKSILEAAYKNDLVAKRDANRLEPTLLVVSFDHGHSHSDC